MFSLFAFAQEYESPSPVREGDLLAIKTALIKRYPELAASPGYRYTFLRKSIGEPGCDSEFDTTASTTTQWVGMATPAEGEFEMPLPTCSRPVADIYFAPFRENGTRSTGAHARCNAPVTHPDTPPPWDWTCDFVQLREYVQLEDQGCSVTLIGELSDAQLRMFKEAGLSSLAKEGGVTPESMTRVVVHPGGRVIATFGDRNCRYDGNSVPTAFFMTEREEGSDVAREATTWKVVDGRQWSEYLDRAR